MISVQLQLQLQLLSQIFQLQLLCVKNVKLQLQLLLNV